MIIQLISLLKVSGKRTVANAPKDACPNCWGEQEYNNTTRQTPRDKQIAVNNHIDKHAFIKQFMVNRIDGIHLRKGTGRANRSACLTCED